MCGEFLKKIVRISGIIFAVLLFAVLVLSGVYYFSVDRSAEFNGEEVYFNGNTYVMCYGEYSEGKRIAKTKNGWDIHEVEEDSTHNFIVARQFLDQHLYVNEDYVVPTDGTISAVVWDGYYITDKEFCCEFSRIMANRKTDFAYETEGIFLLNDNQKMKQVYLSYNECPVATNFAGYMGKVNGQWVITTHISDDQIHPDGSPKAYTVECYIIPDDFAECIENNLKDDNEILKNTF